MKRLSEILNRPTLLCFIVLVLWGERIRAFSSFIYFVMFIILIVGYATSVIQNNRDTDKAMRRQAVEEYKKENGIIDDVSEE